MDEHVCMYFTCDVTSIISGELREFLREFPHRTNQREVNLVQISNIEVRYSHKIHSTEAGVWMCERSSDEVDFVCF